MFSASNVLRILANLSGSTGYRETCLIRSPVATIFLPYKAGGCISKVSLYMNDMFEDFQQGDLIKHVSLFLRVN